MGNTSATCKAPTFAAAFKLGATVETQDGEVGQILQRNFCDGQYRYCIAVPGRDKLQWHWEGLIRTSGTKRWGL